METTFSILLYLILSLVQTQAHAGFNLQISQPQPLATQMPTESKKGFRHSSLILTYEGFLREQKQGTNLHGAGVIKNNEKESAIKKLNQQDLEKLFKENGGVTDGGGNKVGTELFDYWIKVGTQEIPFQDLLEWNPQLMQLLDKLREYSPDERDLGYTGWYTQIILAASKQKWILDSKPISNIYCWNISPNLVSMQEVVGCNSIHEVKISGYGLFEMNDESQAGFILHELLLSWARFQFGGYMSKYDLEEGVREINYSIKMGRDIKATIKKYFPRGQVLTVDDIKKLKEIKTNMFFDGVLICKNEPILNTNYFKTVSQSSMVMTYLGAELEKMLKVIYSGGSQLEPFVRTQFCFDMGIYKVESVKDLTSQCKRSIDATVDLLAGEAAITDPAAMMKRKTSVAHNIALHCYDTTKLASEEERMQIYLQSLEYFARSGKRYQYFFNKTPLLLPDFNGPTSNGW